MVSTRSYMIVAQMPGTGRHARVPGLPRRLPRTGRHRLGGTRRPGAARQPLVRPARSARARHRRRTERRSMLTARYASVLVLLGTIGVSGWFAAAGAAAVAQMIQP